MTEENILTDVINNLRLLDKNRTVILPHTRIFAELDFDSLQMVNFLQIIMDKYGMDFLAEPYTINDLRTPSSIANAIHKMQK